MKNLTFEQSQKIITALNAMHELRQDHIQDEIKDTIALDKIKYQIQSIRDNLYKLHESIERAI